MEATARTLSDVGAAATWALPHVFGAIDVLDITGNPVDCAVQRRLEAAFGRRTVLADACAETPSPPPRD
jgi:hypothetical protein